MRNSADKAIATFRAIDEDKNLLIFIFFLMRKYKQLEFMLLKAFETYFCNLDSLHIRQFRIKSDKSQLEKHHPILSL